MKSDKFLNIAEFNGLSESSKAEIENTFNEAVETRAEVIAVERINEALGTEKIKLVEEYEEKYQKLEESMINKIDEFLNEQVEEIVQSIDGRLEEAALSEKSQALLSIFSSMVETTGLDTLKLYEKHKENSDFPNYNLEGKYNKIHEKYAELQEENTKLKQECQILEMASGMSGDTAEKFKTLARLIKLDENFSEKLEELVETLGEEPLIEYVDEVPTRSARLQNAEPLIEYVNVIPRRNTANSDSEPLIEYVDEVPTRSARLQESRHTGKHATHKPGSAYIARYVKDNGPYTEHNLGEIDGSKF